MHDQIGTLNPFDVFMAAMHWAALVWAVLRAPGFVASHVLLSHRPGTYRYGVWDYLTAVSVSVLIVHGVPA